MIELPGVDEWVSPGSMLWWLGCAAIAVGRGADMVSTWIATPRLELEGNPIARWLGWRRGVILNILLLPVVACWPMLAISLSTTSCLVAARNLQQAWLMRSMGESRYRCWLAGRIMDSSRGLVVGCYLGEGVLVGGVGTVLMVAGPLHVVSFGIGLGLAAYGFAVAVFTFWSLWRSS
jgi:hypothetical protein